MVFSFWASCGLEPCGWGPKHRCCLTLTHWHQDVSDGQAIGQGPLPREEGPGTQYSHGLKLRCSSPSAEHVWLCVSAAPACPLPPCICPENRSVVEALGFLILPVRQQPALTYTQSVTNIVVGMAVLSSLLLLWLSLP